MFKHVVKLTNFAISFSDFLFKNKSKSRVGLRCLKNFHKLYANARSGDTNPLPVEVSKFQGHGKFGRNGKVSDEGQTKHSVKYSSETKSSIFSEATISLTERQQTKNGNLRFVLSHTSIFL